MSRKILTVRIAWGFTLFFAIVVLITSSMARISFLQSDPYGFAAALEQIGVSTDFFAVYFTLIEILFALLFMTIGVLIFWKASGDWMAILVSTAFITLGVSTPLPDTLMVHNDLWFWPVLFLRALAINLTLLMFYLFPDGHFVPGWTRLLSLGTILYSASWFLFPELIPPTAVLAEAKGAQSLAQFSPLILLVVIGVGSQIYRFNRVSSTVQRQQTKWVVLGIAAFLAIVWIILLPFGLLSSLRDSTEQNVVYVVLAGPLLLVAMGLVPLSTALAILRYRLWDISIIVRKTVGYALLTTLLAIVYLGIVILLQSIFEAVSGQQSAISIVISTLVIAALFAPLRRWVQDFIDRRFYRRRYDAAQMLTRFSQTAREEVELEALTSELLHVVQDTMQPDSVSLWIKPVEGGDSRTNRG
ncbi:MAG: hypothetical protein JSV68_05370 [Anaerolineaceae bacterium]|nr:MAG: hypothetical protein JSV68_05370 [Anaerolineaceae bacterium]